MAVQINPILFVVITLVVLGIVLSLMQRKETEGFQTNVSSLVIHACPTFASEIQTAKGSTDCCQGDMVDGKCNGTTFCTKSPAYPGVPACIDKWREYFTQKSNEVCPASMPNYYEDVLKPNSRKGCSASTATKDGKLPSNASAKQCRIYATELENRTKADSCYIERMRLNIQCPVVNGASPLPTAQINKSTNTFEFFFCQYPFEINIPDRCFDKASAQLYFDRTNPNWKTNSALSESLRDQFCENYVSRRNKAREEAQRLEAERRAREAAEQARKQFEDAMRRAQEDARRRADEASRLQQQLDEANRRRQGTIQFAWYGGGYRTRGADVTQQVRNALNSGAIAVNNKTFGDPAPGVYKQLFVDFTPPNSTTPKRVTVGEGGTLSFLA